ncbi:MAG: beta-propeller domain-containing protein, partial [Planctomycetota bacterium]|nr:beta-propeller domain-containing protein [Planctomycetota bacterium]
MKRALIVVLASGMMMGSGCFLIPSLLLGDPELRPFMSAAEMAAFVNAERQRQSRSFGGGLFLQPLFALDGAAPPLATDADSFDGSGAGDDGGVSDATSESGDFSTTTIQEVGVDEGDLVKNDASYIYVLKDAQVRIVKAQPAAELSQASSVDLPGRGVALYLRDDQLIAITSNGGGFVIADIEFVGDTIDEPAVLEADAAQDADVIAIAPEEPQVRITVIDVTDRTAPSVTRTVTIEGSLVNSRMIDNRLHLILQKFPSFSVETLTEDDVPQLLPRFVVTDSDGEDGGGFVVEPTEVFHPLDPSGVTLTTVSTVNVDTGDIQAISV